MISQVTTSAKMSVWQPIAASCVSIIRNVGISLGVAGCVISKANMTQKSISLVQFVALSKTVYLNEL